MKKTILLFAITCLSFTAIAQNVKKDADGNYTATQQQQKDTTAAKNTGKTYSDKDGIKFPVFISTRGKLFVLKTSKKTGNSYKMYLSI